MRRSCFMSMFFLIYTVAQSPIPVLEPIPLQIINPVPNLKPPELSDPPERIVVPDMPVTLVKEEYEPELFPSEPPLMHEPYGDRNTPHPAGRWLHSIVGMKSDEVYIFGGVVSGTALMNDLWTYNGECVRHTTFVFMISVSSLNA